MAIIKNTALTFLDTAVLSVSRILMVFVVSRVLGAAGLGQLQVFLTAVFMAASIAVLGLSIANTYYAGKNPDELSRLLANSAVFSAVSGAAAGLVTVLASVLFAGTIFAGLPPLYRWWIAASVPLQTLNIAFSGLLLGLGLFREKMLGSVIQYGLLTMQIGVLALAGSLRLDAVLPFYVLTLVLADAYWTMLLSRRALGRWRVDLPLLRRQMVYGGYAFVYNLAHLLNFRFDILLIGFFLDSEHVGWYSLAASITEAVLYLPKAFGIALLSKTASEGAGADRVSSVLAYKGVQATVIASALATAAAAPFLIPLIFGPGFRASIQPLWILLPGTSAMALGIVASFHLFGLGDARRPSLAATVSMVATVVLGLVLIPLLGIRGAAAASTLSFALFAAWVVPGILPVLKVRARDLLWATPAEARILFRMGWERIRHAR